MVRGGARRLCLFESNNSVVWSAGLIALVSPVHLKMTWHVLSRAGNCPQLLSISLEKTTKALKQGTSDQFGWWDLFDLLACLLCVCVCVFASSLTCIGAV